MPQGWGCSGDDEVNCGLWLVSHLAKSQFSQVERGAPPNMLPQARRKGRTSVPWGILSHSAVTTCRLLLGIQAGCLAAASWSSETLVTRKGLPTG